jgi:hypothetical protein
LRWILYGDVNSRHAVDALIAALERAGQEVAEVPAQSRRLRYEPDPEVEAEARRSIEAELPADVLLNLRPEKLSPELVADLGRRGVTTMVWLADDPLLFRVSYRHVAPAYDVTLHSARADVLEFYERKLGVRGYSFPFWTDEAHFPPGYDPDAADIEVGFLGNCHRKRRQNRYELLASLPWKTRFFGQLPPDTPDDAGIHAGYLSIEEMPAALRRFRVGFSMAQSFAVRDKLHFRALPQFGEYFFPSRLVLYAAVGIPTVSLTLPGHPPPFPGVRTATDRDGLVEVIRELIDDREALLAASAEMSAQFRECLAADTRVAMLLSLAEGERDHDVSERANLWRAFGPASNENRSAA